MTDDPRGLTDADLVRAVNIMRQQIINTSGFLWFLKQHERDLCKELEARGAKVKEMTP